MRTLQQRRSFETRETILRAAYRVFAEKGYAQATVDDVAAAAGASKGAVYHHFASKEALFRALLSDHGHELDAMASAVIGAGSFQELIGAVAAVWIDHYRSDPLFLPLALEMRVHATRAGWARKLVDDFYRQLRALIAALLRAGQEAGFVRRDLDVETAAILLFGVLDGTCLQAALAPEHVDLQSVRTPLIDLVTRFLGVPARRGDMAEIRRSMARILEGAELGRATKRSRSKRAGARRRPTGGPQR